MPTTFPPQYPIVTDVRYYGVDPTGTNDSSAGFNAAFNGGSFVDVPAGTYKIANSVTIPQNCTLRFKQGCTVNVIQSDGNSPFIISNKATLIGESFVPINVLSGAAIASVVTNALKNGTQEFAWLRGFAITQNSGSTSSAPLVDFNSLFVNSGIRDLVINCNNTATNGLRVTGNALTGFGPFYAKDIWIFTALGSNIIITENNPTGGPCTFWLDNITSENQASGFHGLELTGFGGLSGRLNGYHWEHGSAVGATTSGLYLNGVANSTFDNIDILYTTSANKIGVLASNSGNNARISGRNLRNYNSLPNILQDLTGAGLTLSNVGHVPYWTIPMTTLNNNPKWYGPFATAMDFRRSYATQAFTTPFTPIATSQEYIEFALSNNVTINAPAKAFQGQQLTFKFVHDATGGAYTITWNAVFKIAGGAFANTNVANAVDCITFYYDGTNWRERSRAINA